MLYFIIGFVCAWFLLAIFIYVREDKGGITLWDDSWDCWVLLAPAVPLVLFVGFIITKKEKRKKEKRKGEGAE